MSPMHSDKNVRYDRQLRLWGDHGQQALERSHVCLLNANAVGTEVLKSLILPGIGRFTIVDGNTVSAADTGSNFFLSDADVGKSRAEVTCEYLEELNKDVKGSWIAQNPEVFLQDGQMKMLAKFSVVIGAGLSELCALEVGAFLWPHNIPFVLARCYGLIGSIRVAVREHTVIESHPDTPFPDFRLETPFPELMEFVDQQEMGKMSHKDHSHTPYLVLLMKAVQKWQILHPGQFPSTYAEKKEIREIIVTSRMPDEKGSMDEDNFTEALNALNVALIKTGIPPEVDEILKKLDQNSCEKTTDFWVLCQSLKVFIERHKQLPLRGSLPDMTADSTRYVQLQDIFQRKAEKDIDEMFDEVKRKLSALNLPPTQISRDVVKLFCRNAAFLKLIEGRSLELEYGDSQHTKTVIRQGLISTTDSNVIWYILLRGCDRFFREMNRFPGTNGIPIELDKNDLKNRVCRYLQELGVEPPEKLADFLEEMCRFGAAELHSVAAVIGGAAAQEVIKLVTHQFVPLNNTFLYNGITGGGSVHLL